MRAFLLCLPVMLLTACKDAAPEKTESVISRPVKLFTVPDSGSPNIRRFPAKVEANQGSYLSFRVNGELIEFPTLAGQAVKKGDVLAKLDPEDFKLQLADREARYKLAKNQLERTETLKQKGIASQAELDQAKANMQVALSALEKAQTDLEYTVLRAPFSGTISKVFIKNFESVVAKQNIMRIETRDLMDVTIQIPEKLVARVDKQTNYKPQVVFDSFPNKAYSLSLKEWDTQADPLTLSYRVVFTLPLPSDFNLLAGMTGNVLIDLNKVFRSDQQKFTIPTTAVFSDASEHSFVWRFNDGSIEKVKITLGEIHKSGIEVESGLQPGDKIVSAGVHQLSEQSVVRPWTKERGL